MGTGMRIVVPLLLSIFLQVPAACVESLAQAQLPSGFYFQTPHGPGQVYVPLDPSGRPLLPSSSPAEPPVPSSPPSPPAPPQALPPDWGFLRTEVEPGSARVYIDGHPVGITRQFSGPQGFITLAPGLRQLEIVLPGFKPLRTTVEISSRQTYVVQARLDPDPDQPLEETRGGGYHVVPRGAEKPSRPAGAGGGYFVVPKP
jgi:hypothetical protein